MSQNDFTIANQTFPNTRADINSALQALASTSSGSSAPSTTFANQFFYNTTSNLLQIRNEDNDAFITIAELDQTNDTVEYFKSDSVRTALIEFSDGDDALAIADGGALTVSTSLDMNGTELILDADADTSITADTDDRIDIKVGNTDRAYITANTIGGIINRQNAKPLIINGDMQVAQRGTSLAGQTGSGYQMDRFGFLMNNFGTWTMSQADDGSTGSGFTHALKWDCTTADTSLGASDRGLLHYRFEGQDVQGFKKGTSSAEKLTVSFWVKSAKTGTYIAELADATNTRFVSKAYTISSADTWEKKILSFPADTTGVLSNNNVLAFAVQWWLGAGSTYSSGTLGETWNTTQANRAVGQVNLADSTDNDWYITGVQLEVGEYDATTIPPFQHESYGDNLQRCKRYCQSTFSQGTAIGSATAVGVIITCAAGTGIGRVSTGHQFPVSFRAPPTIVIHNQTGGTTGSGRNGDTGGLITMSAGNASTDAAHFENSGAMGNDGAQLQFQFSATSEL